MKIITTLAALLVVAACVSPQQQVEYELDRQVPVARALWPGLEHVHDHELREEIRRCNVDFIAREGRDFDYLEAVGIYKQCFIEREWLSANVETLCPRQARGCDKH